MDAVQQQPPQRFIRPPDHQQRPSPPLPQAPSSSWYSSSQFQFNPQPQPQLQPQLLPHWEPTNPPGYPPPPGQHPPPYPIHHYPSPFPPPPPPLHSRPPHPHGPHPQSSLPQAYPPPPPSGQAWGSQNWGHQPSWDYQDRAVPPSNEQDWAARARAWAAAKAAMESHQQTTQVAQYAQPVIDRTEEQKNQMYHDHYQQSHIPSSHQQLSVSLTNHPVGSSFSSGAPLSYALDGSAASFNGRDGATFAGTTDANNTISPRHASISSVYQQEVPSSYTSIPGKEESGSRNEPVPFAMSAPHQAGIGQINSMPAGPANIGPMVSVEQPHYALGVVHNDSSVDTKSQDDLIHHQANYVNPDSSGADHYTSVSSVHGWAHTPSTPGYVLPPVPTVPAAQQYDSSFLPPSSLSAPVFGRMTGPTSLRPNIPPPVSVSTTPFAFGAGPTTALHPASVFPGDVNGGAFSVSERPKKAPVPNWLREEIIKNKNIIASSVQENQHDIKDSQSPGGFRDEGISRPPRKGDQSDMKGDDSPSRSTIDEGDDDEDDEVEAARAAAINQEIKRILTEVLLKVTDDLFDEIATNVLNEEDALEIKVDNTVSYKNQKASPSPPAVLPQKASAKILAPVTAVKQGKEAVKQVKELLKQVKDQDEASSENSVSTSPGDVLGLGNYASDDDEVHGPGVLQSTERQKDDVPKTLNKENNGAHVSEETENSNFSPNGVVQNQKSGINNRDSGLVARRDDTEFRMKDEEDKSKVSCRTFESTSDSAIGGAHVKLELIAGHHDNSKENKNFKTEQSEPTAGHHDNGKGNRNVKKEEKDTVKEDKSSMKEARVIRKEEKVIKKDKNDERKGSSKEMKDERRGGLKQDVEKDQVVKPGEKFRDLDSKKNLQHGSSKDGRKEREAMTERTSNGRDDQSNRKREWGKGSREDRSMRHGDSRDSDRREKRQRSSSATRGRKSGRTNSFDSPENSGSDDESDRKSRGRKLVKRRSSPSPSRSRRRQVSRSPHSKHSQRRHSPYSSNETRRRRSRSRSRSASPVRRRR